MTNAQLFSYPIVNLKFNKDLIASDAVPDTVIRVIWGNLLGKDNKELAVISLINSMRFAIFIEKTRKEFKKNHSNLSKFPKMNEDDWE